MLQRYLVNEFGLIHRAVAAPLQLWHVCLGDRSLAACLSPEDAERERRFLQRRVYRNHDLNILPAQWEEDGEHAVGVLAVLPRPRASLPDHLALEALVTRLRTRAEIEAAAEA